MSSVTNSIFSIQSEQDFENACLETFQYQYENVETYKKFVDFLKIDVSSVKAISDIPFIPIELFKNHRILNERKSSDFYFQSSGTTQINLSKHWIADKKLYEKSIEKSFSQFIGDPSEYVFLGLLPNYLEKKNSSLIYMVNYLMMLSNKKENGYFLYNHAELMKTLEELKKDDKKVVLFGVSFALLDFLDAFPKVDFPNLIIIETGGMKGRKTEMTKDELLDILQKGYGSFHVYSEYSMTELLSQAYSLGENRYQTPNWMRILIRDVEDPFKYMLEGRTGAINIVDLANRYSCSFIATQDLGKKEADYFQVLGRMDHSDIRGCSLLIS